MEKVRNATSGYLMVLVVFLTLLVGLAGIVLFKSPIFILIILVAVLLSIGFTVVNPNKAVVMTLFGAYSGTIKTNGFFWVNPFFVKRKISLRAKNFNSDPIK
ncbi:MAG: SPFH domain-containing protein, partial [Bacteroidales bacterium]|nr:SPFH domain-containing protein [Bacteroidales bacterium]